MAFGEFTLSKNGRERVATVLRALIIMQIIIAVCLVIFCYNASVRVLSLVHNIQRQAVYFLYGVILIHAYCMKLHYTMGLRLITLILKYSYWPRLNTHCVAWMIIGVVVSLNGLLITASMRSTVRVLMEDIKESLRVGIMQYLTEPSWKKIFDTLQVELRCCGIDRLTDWYEIPWINMDFLNQDSDVVMQIAGADATILPPVTPFSCCNPRTLGPCYHDPIQQANLKEVWQNKAELVARSLHERGCLEAVREPLERVVYGLKCFNTAAVFIQVGIIALMQALRTTARGAVLAGERLGVAQGCLLGCVAHGTAGGADVKKRRPPPAPAPGARPSREGSGVFGGNSAALLLLERRRRGRRGRRQCRIRYTP